MRRVPALVLTPTPDGPDFSSPELWDFWRELFASREFRLQDLFGARATCRALRSVVDAHSRVLWVRGCCALRRFVDRRNPHPLLGRVSTVLDWWKHDVHLPPNLTLLSYEWHTRRRDEFRADLMPRSLRALRLDASVIAPEQLRRLPPSLENLRFQACWWSPRHTVNLPRGLTRLSFGDYFDYEVVSADLPRTLLQLEFGFHFNKPLDAAGLPRTLTSLSFEWGFDRPLDVARLPRGLQTLAFGRGHSHVFDLTALPRGLRRLVLGRRSGEWGRIADVLTTSPDASSQDDWMTDSSRRWRRICARLRAEDDPHVSAFPPRCVVMFA